MAQNSCLKDNSEITRETYEQVALTYAQVSAVMHENLIADARKFINLLESSFGPNSKILNVGCGPGRDMVWFDNHNINVTGGYYTRAMLEQTT